MRIRTIKPSFWKSETMATIPKEHRLLAVALLNYADDEGYFQANEALIRGDCFPFDEDSTSVRGGLQELSRIGYIALGTTSEGHRIGRVLNFLEHQRIDKATPSKLKDKTTAWDDSTKAPIALVESSTPEGKGREEEGKKGPPPDGGPVWTEALTILTEQGQSEKTARAFLGMLCRDFDEKEIVDAVKASVGKADAPAYIRGVLKNRPRRGERESRRLAI